MSAARTRDMRALEAQASQAIVLAEWRAALPLLCRLILRAPPTFKNLPAAYAALAHVYLHLGRTTDAVRAIDNALALAPHLAPVRAVEQAVMQALQE